MKSTMTEEKTAEQEDRSPLELPAGETGLRQAIHLISSLISLSYSTKTFTAKWQSIRNKLEQLNSGLTAAENCSSSEDTPFQAAIQSILSTSSECHDLARRCVDFSYSGKLLMQSDLDVVAAKFDQHIKDITGIYTTGILTQAYAIVVSRPSVGAGRDDMKFYVRDLSTRLKIGDTQMKIQALIALNEILLEEEKYVRIVIEVGEIISLLVNFLEFPEAEIQEESVEAISVIAGFDSCKSILVGAGVVAPLIRVLEVGSDLGKERSARALWKLTENSDNAWLVSAHGGVTVLLNICCDGNSNGELIGSACGILKNLAGVDEIKRFIVEEGAVSVFLKLARSKDEVPMIRAIESLQSMACGDESIRRAVIREGGIQSLVRVLDPKSSFSSKTREIAMRAVDSLCFSSMNSLNILMGSEFLNWVLFFVRNGDVSIQESAVKVAFRLCGASEETKKTMGDAGFMPELVKLLDSKSFEIREMAAEALSNMVLIPKNRRRFIQDDTNIVRVLQLLDPEEEKLGIKKILLSLLVSLSNSNTGRRRIVASGYLKHLEKLAEADVTEAKRIIKKLSENKLRNIFKLIWNS
ncbi:vacuolar protein 8 [Magnolia sinica]|uniref:vacuolar protein 8 n=1 Tax=Magnolia sinica TaxID=86752 RepID=UPI002658DF35|nr:vacuolar protein 8 [Magnolia sinica]